MYSWEITNLMEHYNYNLPSYLYLDITRNSSQINKVTYIANNREFEIRDRDGGYWRFTVYYAAA